MVTRSMKFWRPIRGHVIMPRLLFVFLIIRCAGGYVQVPFLKCSQHTRGMPTTLVLDLPTKCRGVYVIMPHMRQGWVPQDRRDTERGGAGLAPRAGALHEQHRLLQSREVTHSIMQTRGVEHLCAVIQEGHAEFDVVNLNSAWRQLLLPRGQSGLQTIESWGSPCKVHKDKRELFLALFLTPPTTPSSLHVHGLCFHTRALFLSPFLSLSERARASERQETECEQVRKREREKDSGRGRGRTLCTHLHCRRSHTATESARASERERGEKD